MNTSSNQQPVQGITTAFLRWKWIWIASTAICTIGGVLYVQIGQPRQWTATQRLSIDEDFGEKLFDFANSSEFLNSTAKQASLEYSQKRNAAIDPSKVQIRLESVTAEGSDEYRKNRSLAIQVSANSKEQAVELAREICKATTRSLREAFHTRLNEEAVQNENLAKAVASDMESTEELLATLPSQAEQELGLVAKDVVWSTADSGLKRRLNHITVAADRLDKQRLELQQEWRRAKQFLDNPVGLLEQRVSEQDRNAKLKELRKGWAESLMQITAMKSRYTEAHPLLIAARETERSLAAQVEAELENYSVLLKAELETNQSDILALKEEQFEVQVAMGQMRTFLDQYADATDRLKQKREEHRAAETALATSLARRDFVATANLVTPEGAPTLAATKPEIQSSTVVAGATLTGLILGFGLIFLFKPLDAGLKQNSRTESKEEELLAKSEPPAKPKLDGENFESQEESLLNELAATVTELRIAGDAIARDQDSHRPEGNAKEQEAKPQLETAELVGAGTRKFSEEANSLPQPK